MNTKLISILGILVTLAGTAAANDQPPMKCTVYRGEYGTCDFNYDGHYGSRQGDQCKLMEWDSATAPHPYHFKYYGVFQNESVYIIWGVNIGASASPDSKDRFEIFGTPMKNGVFSDITVKADTDAIKLVDQALYVPVADVSIVCKNY